ncbi:MAG: glycosyltransferase family 4 protein [Halobacteriota archaeon]
MRILLVSELFPFCDAAGELQIPGGGENHMYAVGRELVSRNQVTVLTSRMPEAVYPNDQFPFKVRAVDNRKTSAHRSEDLRYAIRLAKELKRIGQQFDVIVPQTFIPILSSFLTRTKVAVVPIVHDVYQSRPLSSGIATWRDLQGGNTLRGFEGCLLERLCLYYSSTCPAVITVSNSSFELLKHWIPEDKIRITGNGVYLNEFKEEAVKDIDVICIGRFDAPYKNINTVCDGLFNTDILTLIIGDGKLRPFLERRYADKNIQFTGYVSESKKRELLSRSKILISASTKEGFGITLLEGLASGCLVAASDIPAHRFVDQGTGVIKFFTVGDSSAIRSSVVELLHLPNTEREKIRQRARALITKHWQWREIANKTELILESVV